MHALKGSVTRFSTIFLALKNQTGPHMNRQNGLAKFFDFAEILDRKVRKSGVCVIIDYADTDFFFRYEDFHIFNLILWDM